MYLVPFESRHQSECGFDWLKTSTSRKSLGLVEGQAEKGAGMRKLVRQAGDARMSCKARRQQATAER